MSLHYGTMIILVFKNQWQYFTR